MTQDEILEMAKEVYGDIGWTEASIARLVAFAHLVAAKEREALAKEKALQALHNENERLGLYKDAYAQPKQEPATYSAWGLMGGDEFVNKDSLNRNIT